MVLWVPVDSISVLLVWLPGNDLARVLRWGSGYTSEDPHHILVSVDEAEEVLMDRWTILLDAQDISEDGSNNEFLEPPKVRFRVHWLTWFSHLRPDQLVSRSGLPADRPDE